YSRCFATSFLFFFSSRRRHTMFSRDWSSDVCSSDLVATCAICEEAVCENCHKDWEGLHLCPEHFGLYGKHTWLEIAEIRTTPTAPEKGHKLYHFKHKLWSDEKIPAYLVTHYKIDVDGDHIESWVKLFAREEDADQLTTRFNVISTQ